MTSSMLRIVLALVAMNLASQLHAQDWYTRSVIRQFNYEQAVRNRAKAYATARERDRQARIRAMRLAGVHEQKKKARNNELKAKRTQQQMDDIKRVFNGKACPRALTYLRGAMHNLTPSHESVRILSQDAPALKPSNFAQTRMFCNVLRPDGKLQQPPSVLLETRHVFGRPWSAMLRLIRGDHPIHQSHVDALRDAVNHWQRVAADDVKGHSFAVRNQAQQYVRHLHSLVNTIEDAKRRPELARYLRYGGYHFPGGTVADLVDHVVDHQLAIRPGSQAQQIVVSAMVVFRGDATTYATDSIATHKSVPARPSNLASSNPRHILPQSPISAP